MTSVILRRRKLGKTSTEGITAAMQEPAVVVRSWKDDPYPDNTDLVFRWGCTANLPRGLNVVNTSEAIHLVSNKLEFRRVLADEELCPPTWFEVPFEEEAERYIVRTATHHQGRGLWVCGSIGELSAHRHRLGAGNYYISELINKVAEYRVFVGQGRAVWVARKTPGNPDDVAWNVARGGRFDNVRWGDWPLDVVQIAIEAFNLSGLDFGGVDVMVGPDGAAYVLEINSAPSQTSPYRQQCVARFFDWIIQNGRDNWPNVTVARGWRAHAHPAILEGEDN